MGEERAAVREIHWRHVLPWLAIFRSFGVALDLKKMFLGAIGVLLTASGWWVLASVFESIAPENEQVQSVGAEVRGWPWQKDQWPSHALASNRDVSEFLIETGSSLPPKLRHDLMSTVRSHQGLEVAPELLKDPVRSIWQLGTNWRFVLKPVEKLIQPFRALFGRGVGFVPTVFALACAIWAVIVWGLFGGAITRIAAIQFAREEKISLKESLRFAGSKVLSYGMAPVIPLAFIGFFWVLCAGGGFISWIIPGLGSLFAGVLWVLPLLAGVVMAIILLGWAVGWPLMYATISVEGSDSFDALSRSFAYVFQRPWHYLFYAVAATFFGSLCSFFVLLFAELLVYMSRWAVGWGGGERLSNLLDQLFIYAPEASGWGDGAVEAPTGLARIAALCTAAWLYFLFLMLVGFVYSYFWSASTIIYFLLRRDVDNTELQEVFLEGEGEDEGVLNEPAPTTPVVTPDQPTAAPTG